MIPPDLLQTATPVIQGGILAVIVALVVEISRGRIASKRAKDTLELQYHLDSLETMWKKVDKLMDSVYFPLASTADWIARTAEKWLLNPNDTLAMEIFYWYCKYIIYDVNAWKMGSGFILRTRRGEDFAQELDERIDFAPGLSVLELFRIAALLGSPDKIDLAELDDRVKSDDEMKSLFAKFRNWMETDKAAVEKLAKEAEYFAAVLLLELNILHGTWYKEEFVPEKGIDFEVIAKYLSNGK